MTDGLGSDGEASSQQTPSESTIEAPAWLGVIGGGQLGRMFTDAAHAAGYRVAVYSSGGYSPAAQVADRVTVGPYDDAERIAAFAATVAAVTFEFENISKDAAFAAAEKTIARPRPELLAVAQQRYREKETVRSHGAPIAPHRLVESRGELERAADDLGPAPVFKTVVSGYDGHGQVRLRTAEDLDAAEALLERGAGVVEAWIDHDCELSVVVARNRLGEVATLGPMRNDHADHILDVSTLPAELDPDVEARALELAVDLARKLDLEGVLCVEMFLTGTGELLVNELAPRPHNSGHLSIEAHRASQYDLQVRTLCNLPLGDAGMQVPAAAMANLLGDLWLDGAADADAASGEGVTVHLYGKAEPRRRRKMGHITAVGDTVEEVRERVLAARRRFEHGQG